MQSPYSILLLDADGTLFDFLAAERKAFYRTLEEAGLPCDEQTYRRYSQINDDHWRMLERKQITKDRLVVARFEQLLDELGQPGDAVDFNRRYADNLSLGADLLDHAEEICRDLAQTHTLVIATNGVSTTQQRRLELSAIKPYITLMVDSEEAGADKPDPVFFDYLMQKLGHARKDDVLMVGDSLGADIKGGNLYGIDTCWFNPDSLPVPAGMPITHIIHDLRELPGVVRAPRPAALT